MGVSGLLPLLKGASKPAHIADFKGSVAAVDGYCWLHRGAFSCAEKLVMGEKTDLHIKFCMKMINALQANGVRPVVVFDGKSLPSKADTNKKRAESKKENLTKAKMLFAEGKTLEAKQLMKRCVNITPELAHQLICELRKHRIDYVVAPYEADAQLTFLNLNGYVDLIVSEDSDLLLFGCERVLYKMDVNGYGTLVEKSKIPQCLGSGGTTHFTHDKFRWACILSGCDYLENLPGIGLKKTLKFLKPTSNTDPYSLLRKMPNYLKMPSVTVTDDYIDRFVKADNTFLYQLVFCPETKKLRPLNPYPEGIGGEDMPYAGTYYEESLVIDIALSNIHIKTHRPLGERFFPPDNIIVHRKRAAEAVKPASSVSAFSFTKRANTKISIETHDDIDVEAKEREIASEVIQLYATSGSAAGEDIPKESEPVKCERRSLLDDLEKQEGCTTSSPNIFKRKVTPTALETKKAQPTAKIDRIVSRFFVSNVGPRTQVVAVKRKAATQEKAGAAKKQVTLRDLFQTT
ncbi:exonuclease 1 [Galendromus occidentalis]|uniref:Exonuclease 1 n=1 Tax=Galendromus occidentalis TaxID=34638 RepID=A0AAJ7WHX6_9ACAR|nr:exonuclease 1 [Galendromus occidentalis]